MKIEEEWYKRAFNADYSAIYSHRDDASAEKEVAWSLARVPVDAGSVALDLCCGNGRHSAALLSRGVHVVSLDLSLPLLRQMQNRHLPGSQIACADMRHIPLLSGSVGAVFSFFTSFGYFQDDSMNALVLHEISRVLKPEGRVLFDFLNADYVRENLVPVSHDEKDGTVLHQERLITADGKRVEKTVSFTRPGNEPEHYTESVRLYSRQEIEALFQQAGIIVTETFGDFNESDFSHATPRLVCLGSKVKTTQP